MPTWPTQSDYKDALQHPDTAFRDRELQASLAERSAMGVPRARSGAFASVYKLSRGAKSIALKLFNFPNSDRADRYRAVSDYLKSLGPRKPASLVGFDYQLEGIRVGKWWYPTLTMEWVRGKALGEWLREMMERTRPDTAAVRRVAEQWARVVEELQAARIAHGDMQHDNVMVVGNQLTLVDYDGMCVPALAPADPRLQFKQIEFGKPAYQHPARAGEKLGLHLDHFSAWLIMIALRASAADPALYARHVTRTGNENLLFCPADLEAPARSELWPALARSKDGEVREWSRMLRATLDRPFKPFNQVPRFAPDPMRRLRTLVDFVPRDWAEIAAESERLTRTGKEIPEELRAAADPFGRLRTLCNAAKKDNVEIAVEADALTRSGKVVPPDLKPIALDSVKRVNCRDAVRKALDANNPRAVKAAFIRPLLLDWADRKLLADAEAAGAQVEVLDRLKAASAAPGNGRALAELWTKEGYAVAGLPEAEPYRAEARKWQERIAAADAFLALDRGKSTEQQLADAWQRVAAVGRHPEIEREHQLRGELAARRAPVLTRLARVPEAPSVANDTALIAAWGVNPDLAGCPEANRYVSRLNLARDRLLKVERLRRAIAAADAGTGEEAAIATAGKPLANYDHPFADRVVRAERTTKVLTELRAAVAESPPSDRRIASVLDAFRGINVEFLARLETIDPQLAAEAAAAGLRRKVLDEFAQIDRKYSKSDRQDHRWQTLWMRHKPLLIGRRDTEELRARLTIAVVRSRAWADLEVALEAHALSRIRSIWVKHADRLRDYPPLVARRDELNAHLARADRIHGIQGKLSSPDGVLQEEDLRFLRDNHSAFPAIVKDAVALRVGARLNAEARLVAGQPPVRLIANGKRPAVEAFWEWAGHEFVSHCLVAVDPARHLTRPTEADPQHLSPCRIEDHTREGGGRRIVPPPGAQAVFITVWPAVELGWTAVLGPPLHLGPAEVGERKKW